MAEEERKYSEQLIKDEEEEIKKQRLNKEKHEAAYGV